jgi:hypothetical protein
MGTVIWGADYNDLTPPEIMPGEKTAAHRALDVIRFDVDPDGCKLKLLKSGTLNGTIDNHDPLWALFLAEQGATKIRLLVITVNWGRGYDPGEFRDNVLRVTKFAGQYDHVILLVQELDEDDRDPEHSVFASCLVPKTRKVGWSTHEPIALSPGFTIEKRSIVETMAAGLELDPPAPEGTGPTRHGVACIATIGDIVLVIGNTHPHRNLKIKTVQKALAIGTRRFRHQLEGLALAS